MAKEELQRVRGLEVDLVKENQKLLKFYYTESDSWVPLKYYHELMEEIPGLDADLGDIDHFFMAKSSKRIAELLADWITENK